MEVVVALIVRHRARCDCRARLGVVDIADEIQPSLGLIVLRAVSGQSISLSNAVRDDSATQKCGSLAARVLPYGHRSAGPVLEVEVTTSGNVLSLDGGGQ